MKRSILSTFAASLIFSALLGIGSLAFLGPDIALGHYPNAATLSLNVHRGDGGLITQDSTYETSDPLMSVAAWYVGRYHMEPYHDILAQGQCLRLAKVNGLIVIRQTVVVSMCSLNDGTQVFFNQTVYLGQ